MNEVGRLGIIEFENVSKEYLVHKRETGFFNSLKSIFYRKHTTVRAVENISFSIRPGEIVGYIGPNGAGKSTTIKILCGILSPTSGRVQINGINPLNNRKKNAMQIGVVFGQRSQLWWDLPVENSFLLLKEIYKVNDSDFANRMDHYKKLLEIDEILKTPVKNLSLGQRMRAEICAALIHNPPIILLDEPTIGLDIVAKRKIREFILEINKTYNTTVLLTTHDIGDIEKLCSRIIIIDRGKKIYDDGLSNLIEKYGNKSSIQINLHQKIELNVLEAFQNRWNVSYDMEHDLLTVTYDSHVDHSNQIIQELISVLPIKEYKVFNRSTEDIIHDIYTNQRDLP